MAVWIYIKQGKNSSTDGCELSATSMSIAEDKNVAVALLEFNGEPTLCQDCK